MTRRRASCWHSRWPPPRCHSLPRPRRTRGPSTKGACRCGRVATTPCSSRRSATGSLRTAAKMTPRRSPTCATMSGSRSSSGRAGWTTTPPDRTREPGQVLTVAQSTMAALPASDYQTITVRVVTESVAVDHLVEATSLEHTFQASDMASSEVFLYFQPKTSGPRRDHRRGAGPGGLLGAGADGRQGGSGRFRVPAAVRSGPVRSRSLARSVEVLTAGRGTAGDRARHPGSAQPDLQHVILDRVPAAARTSGTVTPDELSPMDGEARDRPRWCPSST